MKIVANGLGGKQNLTSVDWFKKRRKDDALIIENSLRDMSEVKGAPRKEIVKVLDWLFEIGFLGEVK